MFKMAQVIVNKINQITNAIGTNMTAALAKGAPSNYSNYFSNLPSATKIDASTPFSSVNKDLFARAQAKIEGYYNKGPKLNLGQRQFNPGNIRFGSFAQKYGGTLGEKGFAIFPNEDAGFKAMKALYDTPGYKNLTVGGVINRWAPPIENNTNSYINNVVDLYNKGWQ